MNTPHVPDKYIAPCPSSCRGAWLHRAGWGYVMTGTSFSLPLGAPIAILDFMEARLENIFHCRSCEFWYMRDEEGPGGDCKHCFWGISPNRKAILTDPLLTRYHLLASTKCRTVTALSTNLVKSAK